MMNEALVQSINLANLLRFYCVDGQIGRSLLSTT